MNALQKSKPFQIVEADQARRINTAYAAALLAADSAVKKALLCGQLLVETKAGMDHGDWLPWLREHCPEISADRAQRWMKLAEGVAHHALADSVRPGAALSTVLGAPETELDAAAQECRQLLLEFIDGKTIQDCLADCVVGGDDASHLNRAANGKKHGGTKGEDRKAWDTFILRELVTINSHLQHKLSAVQRNQVSGAFIAATRAWPRWLLEAAAEAARAELKLSDVERAGRSK